MEKLPFSFFHICYWNLAKMIEFLLDFNENDCVFSEIYWKWMYFYWNLAKMNEFLVKFNENERIFSEI